VAGDSGFAATKAERVREAGGTLDQRNHRCSSQGEIAERRNKRRRVYTKRRRWMWVGNACSGGGRPADELTLLVRRT
jgi:hypothetical protein